MVNPVTPSIASALIPQTLPSQAAAKTRDVSQSFGQTLNSALENVSAAQAQAQVEARGLVLGLSGASLEKTLVAMQRAKIEWSAAVAVRNGVVNAYNQIIDMPV